MFDKFSVAPEADNGHSSRPEGAEGVGWEHCRLWGETMRFLRFWFVPAVMLAALTGCEYTGLPEGQAAKPSTMGTTAPREVATGQAADPRAAEVQAMQEWSRQQLQPDLPGQFAGATISNTTVIYGFSGAKPGHYDVHFTCQGPTETQLSLATQAGDEVLAPVQVPCDGAVFKAQVTLSIRGVEFLMNPADGADGRYAFRLVPTSPAPATTVLQGTGGLKAVVRSGQSPAPGPEMRLKGNLDKDGAGCLILQTEDGDDYTLIFPEGTNLNGETLVLPAGARLTNGDPLVLTGNRVPADESLSMCLNYARLYSVESAAGIP